LLESGQLRGVDEEELVNSGTHGGPQTHGHHASSGATGGNRSRESEGGEPETRARPGRGQRSRNWRTPRTNASRSA
jgi:hypothetical protein